MSVGFHVYVKQLSRDGASGWACGMTPDWETEASLEGGDPGPTVVTGSIRLLLTPPLPMHVAVMTLRRLTAALGDGVPASFGESVLVSVGDGVVLRFELPRLRSPRRAARILKRQLKMIGFPGPEWEVSAPNGAEAAIGSVQAGGWAEGRAPNAFEAERRAREKVEEARVLELLDGRLYRLSELEKRLDESGSPVPRSRLVRLLHRSALRGACAAAPGVGPRGTAGWTGWVCSRCGATDEIELRDCASCGLSGCPACTECAALGPMRGCEPCYMRAGTNAGTQRSQSTENGGNAEPSGSPTSAALRLTYPLTAAQEDASRRLRRFVREGKEEQALVWAVCGAGKTEVAFAAVEQALREGKRVLFAIPRRSVVAELAPRIQGGFPHTAVEVTYGGARREWAELEAPAPPIVLATTHQALRFYRAFDVVILDEVDAFPYRGSRMLRYAMRRAARPGAQVVVMTATPDEALLRSASSGDLAVIKIPARHHGHPLPVPELVACRLPDSDRTGRTGRTAAVGEDAPVGGSPRGAFVMRAPVLPQTLLKIVRLALGPPDQLVQAAPADAVAPDLAADQAVPAGAPAGDPATDLAVARSAARAAQPACVATPVLLFEPTVALAQSTADVLRRQADELRVSSGAIESVHAGDPKREEKVARLRAGVLRILVATSILERGMTIDKVNVVVLHADYERVFTAASLIQMAGRVGRSRDYPGGRVSFVGRRVNGAMRSARRAIEQMNAEGRRQGFIQTGGESSCGAGG